MNVLLSVANGALQYHRGKQTGLVGLAGIALALLIAFQWNHILPVLDALGVVDFLNKYGLIYEGEPGLTGFVLFTIAFRAAVAFILVGFIFLVIAMAASIFTSSKAGFAILYSFITIPLIPIMIIWMIYDHFKTPQAVKEERKKASIAAYEERMKTVSDIIHESSTELSKEQVLNRLNRLPTIGDDLFLIGITHKDEYFVILPKPKAIYPSNGFSVISYDVAKNISDSFGNKQREKVELNLTPKYLWGQMITSLELNQFKNIYHTEQVDFLKEFKNLKSRGYVQEYISKTQDNYFTSKGTLLKLIGEETDGDKFDELVKRVTEWNAINEDVVKLMYKTEGVSSTNE